MKKNGIMDDNKNKYDLTKIRNDDSDSSEKSGIRKSVINKKEENNNYHNHILKTCHPQNF